MGITNRSFSASPVRSKHSQTINSNNNFILNNSIFFYFVLSKKASLSFSNQDTQAMLNQLLPNMNTNHIKINDSFPYNSHLKTSNSFDSESISTTKRPSRKKSSNETDYPLTRTYPQASSVIHIITPNLHLSSSSSILANPVLLTPDAFLNSPTNTSRCEQPHLKKDMLHNLLVNRTGSLTQVTAPVVMPIQPKAVNQNTILNKIHQRAHSSSISTSTSSSSSCFSCMNSIDQTDKGTTSISVTKSSK